MKEFQIEFLIEIIKQNLTLKSLNFKLNSLNLSNNCKIKIFNFIKNNNLNELIIDDSLSNIEFLHLDNIKSNDGGKGEEGEGEGEVEGKSEGNLNEFTSLFEQNESLTSFKTLNPKILSILSKNKKKLKEKELNFNRMLQKIKFFDIKFK